MMRPDAVVRAAFEYVLALGAVLYGVQVIAAVVMANRRRLLIHDEFGR
jgi:hypothetical protein